VSNNVIRKYLLGQTSEDERLNLEERLLADDDTYEELLILEDELTDEYLRGQLSQTERKNFETHFLSTPSRLEKLRFAKAVRGHLATHAQSKKQTKTSPLVSFFRNPVLTYAVAFAAILLIVSVSWIALRNSRGPGSTVTLTLTPGLTRSGGSENSVKIPPDADTVRVQLVLADDESYQSYNAVFESVDGRIVAREQAGSSELANSRRVVTVDLSSSLLPAGEYRVKLSGVSAGNETVDLGSYSFKILAP
jgi:hypothetical protein